MKETKITWDEFKNSISQHIKEKRGPRLCRGQADSTWKLKTSFHRANQKRFQWKQYFELAMPVIADHVCSAENRKINIADPYELASFLGYLQHHGFPTPFLDWTLSPYIAAYFAFSTIDSHAPASDDVSIYIFDYLQWQNHWQQIRDYTVETAHLTLIQPRAVGNIKQIRQQGLIYTFTNVEEIEQHISIHEQVKKTLYLEKYNFSVKERPYVMTDLIFPRKNGYGVKRLG